MSKNITGWKKQVTLFLTSQTISLFGSSLVQYAIIWHITLTTLSGTMMMISTACGFLPQIIISFFAGAWIDRYDRKILIILSDATIALATLAIAISFLLGYQNVWLLYAVLIIRSAGTGIQAPAVNAFIPQITPQDKLMKVNGINSSIGSLIMFLSPALSGVILSLSSIETTFFIDVITAIIGISIMLIIKARDYTRKENNNNSNFEDMKKGLHYLKKNNLIKNLLLFQLIVIVMVSPSAFLTPLMVGRSFGAEVWRLTINEMTFSAGAILGGIIIALWGGFKNHIHTIMAALIFYGLLTIGMGLASNFILYLILNTIIGIALPTYNTPITVLFQEKVEPYMHGRIFSFMHISISFALPFGMIIFGPFADIFSVQSILIFSGSSTLVITLFTWKNKYLANT